MKRARKQERGNSPTVGEGCVDANGKGLTKPSRKSPKAQSVRSARVSKGMSARKSLHEFSPTLGDIDLHLFHVGRHERIYEKLGARLTTHERKRGVAFAVCAPREELGNP